MTDFGVTPEFKALMGIELDLADAQRRLVLAQAEIDHLNKLADMHNAHINQIHRDLHEAANLIGDIHQSIDKSGTVKSSKALNDRIAAHVEKHGHPQDVPETEDQDQLRLTDG